MAVNGEASRGAHTSAPGARGRVLGFAGFRRSVTDLARSVAFYCDGLGFVPDAMESEGRRPGGVAMFAVPGIRSARLRLGAQAIELVEHPVATWSRSAPGEIDTGFQHLAIVAGDLAAAHARLMACAPTTLTRGAVPVRLPESAGGVGAFKFLDPDGHPLELIHFPPGSGDAMWQQPLPGAVLTLGIDHSAIVVADVARRIAFYRDGLGFTVEARQVNRGPAQERLDGLDRAVIDVVALRPAGDATPHLELLGYGVPAPHRAPSNPWADQILWWADDPQAIADRVGQRATPFPVELRDPDGHLHLLYNPISG